MVLDGSDHPLLRTRDGHEARVTPVELFFDLVYVFAVTQLSHGLLHHLTPLVALETLVLWFAVWLGWQYTCWTTNWFDPETPPVRMMLFGVMLAGLVMASAIPEAFGPRGLIFAVAYVCIQVGRTVFVVAQLGRDHPLAANWRRILVWLSLSALLWLSGGLAEGPLRIGLWLGALAIEYTAPMFGFAFPGLGRSRTRDWTIEGGHLAERCQLFVIVALGETILTTGARLAERPSWTPAVIIAFLAAFVGTIAAWWIYFGTSSKDGSEVIAHAKDPGLMGSRFHYVHAVLVGGVIAMAVANDLVLAQPDAPMTPMLTALLTGGPAIYLIGAGLYKRIVYGALPPSHLAGLAGLALVAAAAAFTPLLVVGVATTVVMLGVGVWENRYPCHAGSGRAGIEP